MHEMTKLKYRKKIKYGWEEGKENERERKQRYYGYILFFLF